MPDKGLLRRISGSVSHWFGEKFIEHWPSIIVLVVGGGGMGYLASITGWIAQYGPVAWGGVGILTVLVLCLSFSLYAFARMRLANVEYQKKKSEVSGINVLSPIQEDRRINLPDFYHFFFRATENVRFENCDLMGPSLIAVDGCNFLESGFIECDIVIARKDRPLRGAMIFRRCTFLRSRLYRVTFLVTIEQYNAFPPEMRAGVFIISDGRVGDI